MWCSLYVKDISILQYADIVDNDLPASRHSLTQSASNRRPPLLRKLYGTGPRAISLLILPDGRLASSGHQKVSSI